MRFVRSGADPAWPVGGANMSEPQYAASESIRRIPEATAASSVLVDDFDGARALLLGDVEGAVSIGQRSVEAFVGDARDTTGERHGLHTRPHALLDAVEHPAQA